MWRCRSLSFSSCLSDGRCPIPAIVPCACHNITSSSSGERVRTTAADEESNAPCFSFFLVHIFCHDSPTRQFSRALCVVSFSFSFSRLQICSSLAPFQSSVDLPLLSSVLFSASGLSSPSLYFFMAALLSRDRSCLARSLSVVFTATPISYFNGVLSSYKT